MLLFNPFLLFPEINQDSFGRCPNGSHMSPSGDCEKVTDTKGMPRCLDDYHRSPDGDCERVTGDDSSSSSRNNDDEDEGDEDNDNNESSPSFNFDFSNSDSTNEEESDSTNNDNNDELEECLDGFYRNFDGDCEPIINNVVGNDEENSGSEKNSILSNPTIKNEGIVFRDFDRKNAFYDYSDNLLYIVIDSEEIVAIKDKDLGNRIAVEDIENPEYNEVENSIYFLNDNDKINVFDGSRISLVDTGVEIDDLEYSPSNGYMYATSSDYGRIFVINDHQLVKTLDLGLGQVDYLAHNPSNGYVYGVDRYFLNNVIVINGEEIVNSIPMGKFTNIDYLAHNPSNGYMYGVDTYGGRIIVLDSTGIKANMSIGYKIDSLAYEPVKGYMYVVGNEIKNQRFENTPESTSISNSSNNDTLASSNATQPVAQIQQFNQDTGSGPVCCDTSSVLKDQIPGSDGSMTSGKITIIDGTKKVHSLEFENLIENINYNPVDRFMYVLTSDPGRVSLINGTEILDQMEISGNPKEILFTPLNGLAYITKENNYEYSIDVFQNDFLKSSIPIKYLYDEIVINPSKGLVYMLESDILYLIEDGIITDKIIISTEHENESTEELF